MTEQNTIEPTTTPETTEQAAPDWTERLTKFGGDANRLAEAYVNVEQQYTQTRQRIAELEKQLAAAKPATPPEEAAEPEGKEPAGEGGEEPAGDAPEITWDSILAGEYVTPDWQLKPEAAEWLEKQNIPRAVIDMHISNAKQAAERNVQQAYQMTGGKESFDTLISWAKENVADWEGAAELLNGPAWQTTLYGLIAQYNSSVARGEPAAKPKPAPSGTRGTAPSAPLKPFSPEAMAAQRDPRYGKDPVYTKDVERRLQLGYQQK